MTPTFEENKQVTIDPNNQCMACGRRAGKYHTGQPGQSIGIYLINDMRGFKICSECEKLGQLMKKQKLGKSEKRKFKVFKRGFMEKASKIPHVTLDAEGNPVQ